MKRKEAVPGETAAIAVGMREAGGNAGEKASGSGSGRARVREK